VDLGVLVSDRRTATYLPSIHLADLTNWVVRSWIPDSQFLDRLAALRSETQETISLWTAVNLQMEVLHAIEGEAPLSLRLRAGQRFPMLFSAVGTAYLVSLPMTTRAALLHRIESDARQHRKVSDIVRFRAMIKTARKCGHAIAESAVVPDVAGIAVAFSGPGQARPLVVSVGGLASRIRSQEARISAALKRFVAAG
jgi:DNA-binding IclR family transcriptional regulator